MLTNFLWGDDVFISYSRADGISYATALANELAKQEFSCRVDLWETSPGVEMPDALIKALRRSTMLILIATEHAANSVNVQAEIQEFRQTGRSIIVVTAMDVASAIWHPLIAGLPLSREDGEAVAAGTPSPAILNRIVNSFGYTKRNKRVRQAFWATAVGIMLLAGIGTGLVELQRRQARDAASARDTAVTDAQAANKARATAVEKAAEAGQEADRQRGNATQQSKLAERKTAEAAQQSAVAEEQRKIALARNLANRSGFVLNESRNLKQSWPDLVQRAVLLSIEAARRYPSAETSTALRAAAGALPRQETTWKLSAEQQQLFIVGTDRLAAIDSNNVVAIRDLSTQQEIGRVATGVEIRNLVFTPDGELMAATDKSDGVQVWSVSARRRLWNAHGITAGGAAAPPLFTPDGKFLAMSGADEKSLLIFDALTGKESVRLRHPERVQSFHFSPDGKLVVTGSDDQLARIWELPAGRLSVASNPPLPGRVYAVAFSPVPGDDRLAIGADDQMILWNWRTQARMPFPKTRGGEFILFARYSENGRNVYGFGDHGTVWLWDVAYAEQIWTSDLANPGSREEKILASLDSGFTSLQIGLWTPPGIAVWEAGAAREIARILFPGEPIQIAYHRAAKQVAVVERDSPEIHLFDIRSPEEIATVSVPPDARVEFSPKRNYFLVKNQRNHRSMSVWEVAGARQISSPSCAADINFTAFAADGRYLAAACSDDTVVVYETATGLPKARITNVPAFRIRPETDDEPSQKSADNVSALDFSADGKYLRAHTLENGAWIWEVVTGKAVARFAKKGPAPRFSPDGRSVAVAENPNVRVFSLGGGDSRTFGYKGALQAILFSGDSRILAAITGGGLRLWRLSDGTEIASPFAGKPNQLSRFSPAGTTLAVADGQTIEIWGIDRSNSIGRITHDQPVTSLAFSDDGAYLISVTGVANTRGSLVVWDIHNRKELVRVTHNSGILSWTISPNGQYLATGSADFSSQVFDLRNGRRIARLLHEGAVYDVAFRQDGQYLATVGSDKTARVWSINGQEMVRLDHGTEVYEARFSEDGRRLITRSEGTPERVWLLSDTELAGSACRQLLRNLTLDEWRQYFGTEAYHKTCQNLPSPGEKR